MHPNAVSKRAILRAMLVGARGPWVEPNSTASVEKTLDDPAQRPPTFLVRQTSNASTVITAWCVGRMSQLGFFLRARKRSQKRVQARATAVSLPYRTPGLRHPCAEGSSNIPVVCAQEHPRQASPPLYTTRAVRVRQANGVSLISTSRVKTPEVQTIRGFRPPLLRLCRPRLRGSCLPALMTCLGGIPR